MSTKLLPALHETLEGAKQLIAGSGYRISAACYEDDQIIYACSVETCGPATYGHPCAEVIFQKMTGNIQVSGLRGAAKYFHNHDVTCGEGCFFRNPDRGLL